MKDVDFRINGIAVLVFLLCVCNAYCDLPTNFPAITTHIYEPGSVADGYIFLAVASEVEGVGYYLMILDNNGTPYWYRELPEDYSYDFKVLPNGLLQYSQFAHHHSYTGGGDATHEIFKIVNGSYQHIETITGGNGYVAESHDFQLLPNGNALQFGYYLSEVDVSSFLADGNPAALVSGGIIQELGPYNAITHNRDVVFQWRTWDHYDFEDVVTSTRGTISEFHLNTIMQDTDGNIIWATPENVKKISRQTGQIMWHLGGDENEFTFVGLANPDDGPLHFGGHAFTRLDNGNVLIYDNAARRDTPATSTVHEYTLDEVNKIATHVWTYTPNTDIRAWHRGNAQRLPNGNTFIGWGGASGRVIPACTEVTPAGTKVFELYFDNPDVESYRAFRFVYPESQQQLYADWFEVAIGEEYEFNYPDDTGVWIDIESFNGTGSGYNEVDVTRQPYAPVYPEFAGKAPRILPVRIEVNGTGLANGISGTISFDCSDFGFTNPADLTVYYRQTPDAGYFFPIPTTYNPATQQVSGLMSFDFGCSGFGEYVLGYPDLADIANSPILCQPESYRGVQEYDMIAPPKADVNTTYEVNQQLPILLSWSPVGMARYNHIQIDNNSDFSSPIVNSEYQAEEFYIFSTAAPNTTYYYRVRCMIDNYTYGGWSTGSFKTVAPFVSLTAPNGGQWLQRGSDYFIRWQDNIPEVTIDLYKGSAFLRNITTTTSAGAYKWTVDLDLIMDNDYSIHIADSSNTSLYDQSDAVFIIHDETIMPGDFDLNGCVRLDDFAVLASKWLMGTTLHPADLDESGNVSSDDLIIFGQNWLLPCP